MTKIYADIELINNDDLALVRRHYMDQEDVCRMAVNIRIDTGADICPQNENLGRHVCSPRSKCHFV